MPASSRREPQKQLPGQAHKAEVEFAERSQKKRAEHTDWQRRFFEHLVRDEIDLRRCADYIHVNPVKHCLVTRVRDWPWSSFHRWVRLGHYDLDWGSSDAWYGDEFKNFE